MSFDRPLAYHQWDLFETTFSEPASLLPPSTMADATPPSERPAAPAPLKGPPPTFAEALAQIDTWIDLKPIRRRDLASALNCIADKVLRSPLSNIACSIPDLNKTLFQHPPAAYQLGRIGFGSVISRLRAVLTRLGLHQEQELGEGAYTFAWQEFLGHLTVAPLRAGLCRFARYCSRAGIELPFVNDTVLAAFLEYDRNSRLSASHTEQGTNLASAWRTAVGKQPTPACFGTVTAPRRRQRYTFEFSNYPKEFQASVETYRLAVSRVDRTSTERRSANGVVLSPPRGPQAGPFTTRTTLPFRRLKQSSVKTRIFSIRQAAAALVHQNVPIETIVSLSNLVQPVERARQIISFYLERANGAAGSQTEAIAVVLHQIAKYHAEVSDDDLRQIAEWRDEVSAPRTGEMCAKARKCIHALWQPRARAILLVLPEYLEERSRRDDLSSLERARMMRAAVLIEILTRCPLRISNLHSLRLGSHLVSLGGTRRPSHILIEPDEVKNDNAVSFPIPDDAARLIQRYLDQSRPLLAQAGNPFLFPGEAQGPLSKNQARTVFKDYVEGATGVDVYPHAMRHFAGRVFLTHHPGQYEILRRVLGHRDIETTKAFYTGLETDAAIALSDTALLQERAAGRQLARAALSQRSPDATPRRSKSKG